MSTLLTGAVFQCGPREQAAAFVLLAIADNADDHGFAFPSHETIAFKSRCDVRTVIRKLDELEAEGWIRRARKLINGKGNGYLIDLSKLGVTLSPDARRSPVFMQLLRKHGDSLSRFFSPQNSGDSTTISSDNPQPRQVTQNRTQVTKKGGSGDTRSHTNPQPSRLEPSLTEPSKELKSTTYRLQAVLSSGDSVIASRWQWFKRQLEDDLHSVPQSLAEARFTQIKRGLNDYDSCFDEWWLEAVDLHPAAPANVRFVTMASEVTATKVGLEKYRKRIERRLRECFDIDAGITIGFEFQNPQTRGERGDPPEQSAGED